MRKFKLKKSYRGVICDFSFVLNDDKLTATLPFSGEVSFPADIIDEDNFYDYFEEVKVENIGEKIWKEIEDECNDDASSIELVSLYKILEKYNIVKSEKDGM